MQASSTFKKTFLKLMINGLRLNGVHSKMMGIQERKRVIKLTADAAMALARGRTKWSASLIKDLSNKPESCSRKRITTSKKILRRSLRPRPRVRNAEASVVARRMVRRRTQVLKRIIPGGESLDGASLLGETIDYVIHLRAQVNLMQCLASALGASNLESQKSMHCNENHDEMGGSSRIWQAGEEVINSISSGPKKFKVQNVMD